MRAQSLVPRFSSRACARFLLCQCARRPRRPRLQHQDEGPGQGLHHWPVRDFFTVCFFWKCAPLFVVARSTTAHHNLCLVSSMFRSRNFSFLYFSEYAPIHEFRKLTLIFDQPPCLSLSMRLSASLCLCLPLSASVCLSLPLSPPFPLPQRRPDRLLDPLPHRLGRHARQGSTGHSAAHRAAARAQRPQGMRVLFAFCCFCFCSF
jgi:hypothetical protein